jgi:pyrroline-5-carboxylate reductase
MAGSPILMLGCGRMGGAILRGLQPRLDAPVWIVDPGLEAWPGATVVHSLDQVPDLTDPTVLLAVKPQVVAPLLPALGRFATGQALFISVIAGLTLDAMRAALGEGSAIVRTIPNTPAAVLQGVTAAVAGSGVDPARRARADDLLRAVGDVVWLEQEALIDAVTAVSGSGPAYFFRFAEALSQAGRSLGLPAEIAERLARKTLEGSGALAVSTDRTLAELRAEVTSPAGTTAAGLARLDEGERLDSLARETVAAARARSEELGRLAGAVP